ncbi:AAA family ATPase [Methanoplanus limicola]|uniref:SMC domain protein n=1 Tax=Methanoplanus limicola DSM 2279 TaxID=937775 RepID=H1YYR1_9EURY|nr:AAA family ATPase [Methanoplanus limicola]EHQ36044.1 SMC domain protein [Methanoplanus limicola DSM 2279]
MIIKKLKVHNYKGIKDLEIQFTENITIFAGVNGSGKTTVLDAAAVLLSWFIARTESIKKNGQIIPETDINNDESESSLEIYTELKEAFEPGTNNTVINWKQAKTRKGRVKKDESDYSNLNKAVKKIQNHIESGNNIPLIVYYPINRSVIDIPLRIRKKHQFDGSVTAYENSLTGKTNFRTFFEWFREREDFENEKKASEFDENINIQNKISEYSDYSGDIQLNAVRSAIRTFTGFEDLRVRRNPLRMLVNKGNNILTVGQLSDGEKCLLAMVGDLARRLSIANPKMDNPLNGSGIILIDEIDLHLHPKWQRMIIPKLKETFPACQFILTTHSPQIISHVRPEEIILLYPDEKSGISVKMPLDSYGMNSDRILEEILEVPSRPIEIENKISELFMLIDKNKTEEAKKVHSELKDLIGADPELSKAEIIIRKLVMLNK